MKQRTNRSFLQVDGRMNNKQQQQQERGRHQHRQPTEQWPNAQSKPQWPTYKTYGHFGQVRRSASPPNASDRAVLRQRAPKPVHCYLFSLFYGARRYFRLRKRRKSIRLYLHVPANFPKRSANANRPINTWFAPKLRWSSVHHVNIRNNGFYWIACCPNEPPNRGESRRLFVITVCCEWATALRLFVYLVVCDENLLIKIIVSCVRR